MTRLLFGCLMFMVMALPGAAQESETIELRYRSYRSWSIHLPQERWFPVKDGIKIPHAGGEHFAVAFEGNGLRFDTDGDGELDRTIKPLVDPKTNVSTTRVVLSGQTESGDSFRYAARLRNDAKGWEWAPGGALAGIISTEAGPIPIRIIDQNGNGRHDDIGQDAMIVGSSDYASLLSRTVQVGEELLSVQIVDDEKTIKLASYEGPIAEIDMSTSLHSKAVLLSSVIVSEDGQHSFDVGAFEGIVKVPAGVYSIVAGWLGLGEHRVQFVAGRSRPLDLMVDSKTEFDWGGPIEPRFRFVRSGNQVQFSPDQIWYYGRAGEQYTAWNPIGKSPEFKICDADTGAVLEVAILPGSC